MGSVSNKKVMFAAERQAELWEEIFDPEPQPGEVSARTLVSVISTGSETGGYMNYYGGGEYPCATGYAAVLEVLKTGAGVTAIKPGDRVFAQTAHRLYARFPAGEAVPVPAGMPAEHAVLGRFPAVSMTTMLKTAVRPTEPVVVTGLGVVGLCCAQMMQHCGYTVHAADPNPARRQTARECGVANTAAGLEELGALKGVCGLGIECSGNDNATLGLINLVRKGGEVSLVGVPWRSTSTVLVNELFRSVFGGYVTVYSGWEWSLPLHEAAFLPNSSFRSFATAIEWIRSGAIKVEGIYEKRSPADCATVYQSLAKGESEKTCVLFDWSSIN
jgi:threonine dehydrogenase-like Zn-dependent dehydrogenase